MLLRQSGRYLKQVKTCQITFNVARCLSDSTEISTLRDRKFPNALSSALKKGTGGRSSFNGTVVTVFGSSGYLGSNLIPSLCRIGCQVVVPYRGDQYDVARHKVAGDLGQVLFAPYYLRDEESIYKAVKYSNVVINLVGKFNETASFTFDDVHVHGARTIAKVAREAGVNRLIHVSSLNSSPNPRGFMIRSGSNFLRSKYYGELAVREEFPEAIIFRPAHMYGEGDKFFNYFGHMLRYHMNKMYLWNKGKGIYKQPVYSSDVARGIVNAIYDNEILGKTVDAVGCRRFELQDLVQYIMRVTGRGEEFEYEIDELRTALPFLARVWYLSRIAKYPKISMEYLELENITDEVDPNNLTLEDLGVTVTPFEDNAYYELKPLHRQAFFIDEFGDSKEPPLPKSLI